LTHPFGTLVSTGEGGVGPVEPLLRVVGRAVRRGGVFVVGTALLLAGAVMLVLPGPGIAAMLLGLVVLSAEFQWAKRMLAWARERFTDLRNQAQARLPGASRRPPSGPPTRDRPDRAA
jgi:Putative transmembrane protein (PGPGW)